MQATKPSPVLEEQDEEEEVEEEEVEEEEVEEEEEDDPEEEDKDDPEEEKEDDPEQEEDKEAVPEEEEEEGEEEQEEEGNSDSTVICLSSGEASDKANASIMVADSAITVAGPKVPKVRCIPLINSLYLFSFF